MKYVLLAVLAAFSLSVMAGKPTKDQTTGEQALQGVDACDLSIDQPGIKRQQRVRRRSRVQDVQRVEAMARGGRKAKEEAAVQEPGDAGLAVSGSGIPSDKAAAAKK